MQQAWGELTGEKISFIIIDNNCDIFDDYKMWVSRLKQVTLKDDSLLVRGSAVIVIRGTFCILV